MMRCGKNHSTFYTSAFQWLGFLGLIMMCALSVGHAMQQNPQDPATTMQVRVPEADPSGVLNTSGRDYLISPRDVIEIRVEDAPELSRNYQVTTAGEIEMPVLGRVSAARKTIYDLSRLISQGLRDQDYLKSPNVVVTVRQFNSQSFFIQGSVGKPGVYQLQDRPTVLTLIGVAGGLTETHGAGVFILRPRLQGQTNDPAPAALNFDPKSQASADYEIIKVNLNSLYKGEFDQNLRLQPGDIVNVPRADVFFVAGEVRTPGSFKLREGTTLRQAISLAQGLSFKAKASRGMIFRDDPATGARQEIKVDISAVMNGKQPDIPVYANDVILVPNSQTKAIGGALLMAIGANSLRFPLPY